MGSIWKMGRSSDREHSSRGDARIFHFLIIFQEKTVFRPVDVSMICVFSVFENMFFSNMPQKGLGVLGGIPDLLGPIFVQFWQKIENCLRTNIIKIHIQIVYLQPFAGIIISGPMPG